MANLIPGDTTSTLVCSLIDTISVEQTIPITAEFILKNMLSAAFGFNYDFPIDICTLKQSYTEKR